MENYRGNNIQAEQNFGENIIITQSLQKFAIRSRPPKSGKIVQNLMMYRFQTDYEMKLKFSGFISGIETIISAKF